MRDALPASGRRPKVIGIGLNKTGTKTLSHYLRLWGYVHRTYDSDNVTSSAAYDLYSSGDVEGLLALLDEFDSVEDWPWPLLYREIDARFPDARFVLTTRRSSDTWFRSLCNMAVRIGPFPLFETLVYGSGMPQGRRDEHIAFYERHNTEVEAYFRDRPGKLLVMAWDAGDDANTLAAFLGLEDVDTTPHHSNRSPQRVYAGNNLLRAHVSRIIYQRVRGPGAPVRNVLGRIKRAVLRR